jgi:hypothetical protein
VTPKNGAYVEGVVRRKGGRKWAKSLRAQKVEMRVERLVKTDQNWGETEQNRGKPGWFDYWRF